MYCRASYVDFYQRTVTAGGNDNYLSLSNSYGGTCSGRYGVRPAVYLESDIQLEYDSATNAYTIK